MTKLSKSDKKIAAGKSVSVAYTKKEETFDGNIHKVQRGNALHCQTKKTRFENRPAFK